MSTIPEPIGEIDGVPQYAQATSSFGTIIADTPPQIWSEADAEAEAGG